MLVLSEWIAYREVEGEGASEVSHIVVGLFAGVVWSMDAYAEVAAEHQHSYIESQTGSRAEREIAQER